MSTDILPFEFQSQQVRVIDLDGEPWFVAKDVATILGYANTHEAVRRHCKGVAKHYPLNTAGGVQDVRVIDEPDMMRLIVSSKLPAAEAFEKWIFEEVLPQIRKTGQYGVQQLTGPALYLAAIEQATAEIRALEARAAELEPKAARFDDWLGSTGDYSFQQAAKVLQRDHGINTGPRKLIQTLIDWGWCYRHGNKRIVTAYQAQLETGRLSQRAVTYMNHRTAQIETAPPQTRVTPKGMADIAERLTKKQVAA